MGHFGKILVPCDGSPASIEALTEAVALALDLGSAVDLLEVQVPEHRLSASPFADGSDAKRINEAFGAAKEMLGDRVTRARKIGDPAGTIVETADDAYDLIVMGTHGRIGRLHATLGSVAATVVRSAHCPVLTVRTPTGEEESFAERIHRAKSLAQQA